MRGFSLVEMLVSLLIVLTVTGTLITLMHQAQATFVAQTELPDLQQRLRVAADALSRDLSRAGGGPFPSIVPHRRGMESPDAPGTFHNDRVSVLLVPAAAPLTTLAGPSDGAGTLFVRDRPRCPVSDPVCGFSVGTLMVIFDDTGAYDTFRISAVLADPPALQYSGTTLAKIYQAGATVAAAETTTYWLKTDAVSGVSRLMKYDGQQSDLPFAENIAELRFEYYTDAVTRMDPAAFTDGPWLPDPTFANRFDLDLLRIRRVRAAGRVRPNQTLLPIPVSDRIFTVDIALRSQSPEP
jgi:type II secretory pathway pseudopilin PulG